MELAQGGRVDRAQEWQSAQPQEAERLGVHEEARTKSQDPQASSR
jgi:hypothetical protein